MRDTYGVTAITRVEHRQDHRRGIGPRRRAAARDGDRGQHVEHGGGEQRHQKDADDELGQPGQGDHDDLDDVVGAIAAVVGRDHRDAERQRDHDDRRAEHQHGRVDDPGADQLADRQPVGDRGAEVAGEQAAEPVEVADDHRLVEVERRGERRHPLRAGRVVLAEDRPHRVAQRGGGEEDQHRAQPEREDRQPDAAGQPLQPGRARRAPRGRGGRGDGFGRRGRKIGHGCLTSRRRFSCGGVTKDARLKPKFEHGR